MHSIFIYWQGQSVCDAFFHLPSTLLNIGILYSYVFQSFLWIKICSAHVDSDFSLVSFINLLKRKMFRKVLQKCQHLVLLNPSWNASQSLNIIWKEIIHGFIINYEKSTNWIFLCAYYLKCACLEIYNMCKKYLQQDFGSCKRLVLGLGFVNVKSFIN
jgi:hypothetical protein